MHIKSFIMHEKSAPTVDESVASWVISSPVFDRVNDRVMPNALKSQAGKDILCLWQHDSNQPIGRWANVRMKGEKLVGDLVLAKTNLGQMIRELLAVKTPLGSSIGFKGTGKKNEKGGIDFHDISIFETSIVSVPCNPESMAIAKQFQIELPSQEQLDHLAKSGDFTAVRKRAAHAIIAAKRQIKESK